MKVQMAKVIEERGDKATWSPIKKTGANGAIIQAWRTLMARIQGLTTTLRSRYRLLIFKRAFVEDGDIPE